MDDYWLVLRLLVGVAGTDDYMADPRPTDSLVHRLIIH